MKNSKAQITGLIYTIVFFTLCVIPFAGMLWVDEDAVDDSKTPMPVLIDEEQSLQFDYLKDMGDYFEKNFAYRSHLIDANAKLRVGLVRDSATEQVIVGSDGWLYYGGTLPDYLGENELTERRIENIAYNLLLMQNYVEAHGAEFVFTIAPNKNSLYPENMPYYYQGGDRWDRDYLNDQLEAYGISYVDMFELFNGQDKVLYYKTDSHWNNEGALLASQKLLARLNKAQSSLLSTDEVSISGDIEKMLYPVSARNESDLGIDTKAWNYTNEASSVEDSSIDTRSSGEGRLLMFRDSFGNGLIPLLAPEFEQAHFSKLIPYNLTQIFDIDADCVIVERAERHLDLLAQNPPIMPAPTIEMRVTTSLESNSYISIYDDGDYLVVEGYVDESMSHEGDYYVQLTSDEDIEQVYVAYRRSLDGYETADGLEVTSDYGFKCFIPQLEKESLSSVSLLVGKHNEAMQILEKKF